MKIRYIVILLLLASALLPFYYHRQIEKLYLDTYYRRFKKMDVKKALDHGNRLYREGKYGRLIDFLDNILVLYPADRGLLRLKGNALVKKGRTLEGARLIITSLGKKEDLRTITSAIEALFESREYGDIVDICTRYGTSGDPYLVYVYGVSLFHTGRLGEARGQLYTALSAGKRDYEVLYYLGMSLDGTGDTGKAVEYLEEAYRMYPLRTEARSALVRLYRKTGNYDKAGKIIRRSLR